MKSLLAIAVLAGFAGSADAVVLNERGSGQVLLYPYYSVGADNNTLLTIVNTTDHGKAVRVRFREGENGRSVLDFNLYLGRFDSFAAAVFSTGSGVGLVTSDLSCTFPLITTSTTLPQLPDGRRYAPFVNFAYTGSSNDPGSDSIDRAREGSIEVLEMGAIVQASPTEFPTSCGALEAAWNGGYWTANPKTDLTNPTGGLIGSVAIINVGRGTIASYAATALDEFRTDPADPNNATSSVVAHSRPDQTSIELDDALSDPVTARATALLQGTSGSARLNYSGNSRIDAVSAVLAARNAVAEFDIDPAAGASTSVVLNYPTRRYYTDADINGGSMRPFLETYAGLRTHALDVPYGAVYDRSGNLANSDCGFLCPPPPPAHFPGTSVEVVSMTQQVDPLLQSRLTAYLPQLPQSSGPVHSGWVGFEYQGIQSNPNAANLRPSVETVVVNGMPVIGIVLTNYVNSNVSAGVLANYSAAVPLRAWRWCDSDFTACE
jgi:hypothetical protein